jgi:hypothetical protein
MSPTTFSFPKKRAACRLESLSWPGRLSLSKSLSTTTYVEWTVEIKNLILAWKVFKTVQPIFDASSLPSTANQSRHRRCRAKTYALLPCLVSDLCSSARQHDLKIQSAHSYVATQKAYDLVPGASCCYDPKNWTYVFEKRKEIVNGSPASGLFQIQEAACYGRTVLPGPNQYPVRVHGGVDEKKRTDEATMEGDQNLVQRHTMCSAVVIHRKP